MKFIALLAIVATSCPLFTSCGGGGGGGASNDPPTRRPKTLDGLIITVANRGIFTFVRATGSPPALLSGDVETGTFFYALGGTNWVMPAPENLIGGLSDVVFPNVISSAAYTYRAINTNQAVLTLSGVGEVALGLTGSPSAGNASLMRLFRLDTNGIDNNQVELDLSFTTNGSTIQTEIGTMEQVASTSAFDRVRISMAIRLETGGPVPENYNPVLDPLRPSRLAPESLTASRFAFTNTGLGDPSFDFTIQFTSDNVTPSPPVTEVGTGLLRISGAVVDDAVNYTWYRIAGTDSGILAISNGGNTFDGRYTLDFVAPDAGSYTGEVDGDTADVNEVIGTFTVR